MSKSASRSGVALPATPLWSAPIAVTEVPETGRHVEISADAPTRRSIAEAAGLLDVPRLTASFDLTPDGAGGLRVVGRVSATVVQTCVVTLDPLQSDIEEAVDLRFAAPKDPLVREAVASMEEEDPPERLSDGKADLGVLATEFLLLGLDPYPRKPGAVFEPRQDKEPSGHAFAALAALKPAKNEK